MRQLTLRPRSASGALSRPLSTGDPETVPSPDRRHYDQPLMSDEELAPGVAIDDLPGLMREMFVQCVDVLDDLPQLCVGELPDHDNPSSISRSRR